MNQSPVLIFDGVCNLCNRLVVFILNHEQRPDIKFATLQAASTEIILQPFGLTSDKIDSVVFIEHETIYFRSKAIFRILKYLNSPYKFLYVFGVFPLFITDFIYSIIARTRYKVFGKREVCMMPDDELQKRFV